MYYICILHIYIYYNVECCNECCKTYLTFLIGGLVSCTREKIEGGDYELGGGGG